MASTSSISGIRSETRDKYGLCLLSLDGGGVRGLSTLLILKGIMQQINAKRRTEGLSYARPCDVFDLIGGTSTGGLIAIMLGPLQMDIQPCIDAYSELSRRIFSKRGLPVDWRGHVNGRYKASELEDAIKEIIKDSKLPMDAPLNDGKDRSCRVFVCAVRKENKAVARLRTYHSDTALVEDGATIWEAARATSAASGFFDPISIGKHGQEYVDAGLGCNNPVDEVWTEAQDIWSPEEGDLATIVKCFISVGTGNPGTSIIEDNAFKLVTKTLKDIATETEKTAETFAKGHRGLFSQQRYFRFNVDQGLQNVGLEEFKREKEIVSATSLYMESQHIQSQTRDCSMVMKDKALWKGDAAKLMRRILEECQREPKHFQLVFSLATAPEIDYFVGRTSNLSTIESVLLPIGAERKVVVLHGLGGIGKSQLAIEFAKRHRQDYTAVLWLNARTEDTLKRSFAANAQRLPKEYLDQELLYGTQNEEALSIILRKMKLWLSFPGNDRWLLIYDNVDNPKIPDNKRQNAYDIRAYFPEAHQGSILVTTRWETLRIGNLLEVAKLSKDEDSISLLTRMSRRKIQEDPGTKDLLRKLDGLPLALATAGAYLGLQGNNMSISEYLHLHETSWLELQQTSPPLLSYEDQTIFSTWNLSYILIRKEDESAAKLLELWAYFDNRDLWYDLLKAGQKVAPGWFRDIISTKLAFNSKIGKLRKHALIEPLTESDGYSMHNCVHAWVKTVLFRAVEDQSLRLALTCIAESVPFAPATGDWMIRPRLLPHSERCLQLLRVWADESKDPGKMEGLVAQFYSSLGTLYQDQGKQTEAESMYQRALIGYEKALGPDHISTLETVNNLGILYRDQGKLTETESMFQRALIGKEKALGPDHISTLDIVNNLGNLYRDQGKLTEAESKFQRALTGYKQALGPDHISTLETVNNLGNLYIDQGKLTEAESMYQRALIGFEKALGPDHTFTLSTVNNLGNLYKDQGKLTKAESMYQRALLGYTRSNPLNVSSQLNLFYNTALLSRDLEKFERAKKYFNKAYQGCRELFGPQHAETIDALNKLSREIERDTQKALRPVEEVIDIPGKASSEGDEQKSREVRA